MITIGEKQYKTSKPSNLDDQLIAATGCSSREVGLLLSGAPSLAAAALAPFLSEDKPEPVDLAQAIADDPAAIDAIRVLYAPVEKAAEKPTNDKQPGA